VLVGGDDVVVLGSTVLGDSEVDGATDGDGTDSIESLEQLTPVNAAATTTPAATTRRPNDLLDRSTTPFSHLDPARELQRCCRSPGPAMPSAGLSKPTASLTGVAVLQARH